MFFNYDEHGHFSLFCVDPTSLERTKSTDENIHNSSLNDIS